MNPMMIKKAYEKAGVKSYTHHFFNRIWGGWTNIEMAKENPFLVINRYPINISATDVGKDKMNPSLESIGRKI